jgi:hypothetical protein
MIMQFYFMKKLYNNFVLLGLSECYTRFLVSILNATFFQSEYCSDFVDFKTQIL